MARSQKFTGRAFSMPVCFTVSACISLSLTIVLSAILSKLICTERLEMEKTGYWIMMILLIASIIGTKVSCLLLKRRKMMSCVVSGVLYWLGLILITALFFGGHYNGVFISGGIILLGSTIVYLQELKGEKSRNHSPHRSVLKKQKL